MNQLFSSIAGFSAWLLVGLIAVKFVTAGVATLIGFIAFCVVVILTTPKKVRR